MAIEILDVGDTEGTPSEIGYFLANSDSFKRSCSTKCTDADFFYTAWNDKAL